MRWTTRRSSWCWGSCVLQADAIGAGALASIVGLLGLDPASGVPGLPLPAIRTEGPSALRTWFASVVTAPAARTAWLGHLASLLDGNVVGDEVVVAGAAQLGLSVRTATGNGGQMVLTPTLSVSVAAGADARLRVEADLLTLDLATGSARALPRLSAFLQLGRRPDGGSRVLTGDPQVDAVRAGFSVDADRRPTFLLAADGVTIAGNHYPTLDLSTPDALANVGATLVADVLDDLLGPLGPIAAVLKRLFGLEPPSGAPGVPTLSIAAFLGDPLSAVRGYWHTLVHDHPDAVASLLGEVRDLVADAGASGSAVAGSGTDADPWRVTLAAPIELQVWRVDAGNGLELAIAARKFGDTLGQRCTRVDLQLAIGLASLDLARGAATFLSLADVRLTARARGDTRALLEAGPFTLTADHLGLGATWRPATGLSVALLAPNLAVALEDTPAVPLALPVLGADGTLALDAAGWDAVERLVGLLAALAPVPWVDDLVVALGWSLESPEAEVLDRPHLSLADLAADPPTAVSRWLQALALDDRGLLRDGLAALARVLTGSRDGFGILDGSGRPHDPFRLPLLPTAVAPEVSAWLLPAGPALAFTTAPDPIRTWGPGMPGLPVEVLADALRSEAEAGADVAALASGRGELETGLAALHARWTGSDGRIVPPTIDPAGISVHRVANVTADALEQAIDLAALVGFAPAVVAHVAIGDAGAPLPWDTATADRVIDLRAPGLAPEAFTLPTPAAGDWFIALGGRVASRLATGDPDGIAGQAARLTRVLAPFAALAPPVVIVADGGSGHAAIAAATTAALGFVSAVVTLGTPLTPVAFGVLDEPPAADTFRLLRWLIPPADELATDDADLALGRGLVDALARLLVLDDPGRELRPRASPMAPLRAGLAVHAVFGVIEPDALLAAMTAIVAAGLSQRAAARETAGRATATGARIGLRLPVRPATTGITVSGAASIELAGVDASDTGAVLSTERAVHVHLEVRRAGGWLVGGPDPGRGPGPRRDQEVRWIEANVRVPLGGGEASTEVVLHEARIFAIERERWIVRPTGALAAGADVVTPALPEVRVLLSLVAEALEAGSAGSPPVAAALDIFRGLGLIAPQGGFVADAFDRLLHDTGSHVSGALADAARRPQIASGIAQLLSGMPSLAVDLGAGRLVLDATASPGDAGLLPWSAHVEVSATGAASAALSAGSAGSTAAGGARFLFATNPTRASIEWSRAGGGAEQIELWPSPDVSALSRAAARLVPAECARLTLEYLRQLDESARPVIDAALDLAGLLSPATPVADRGVLLPAGLLADPAGWLSHASAFGGAGGFSAARVASFLDAIKPIAGVDGEPGEWKLGSGVVVRAASSDGALNLALDVDTSGFAPIATAAGRLVATGTFSLAFPSGGAPRPGVAVSVGLAGTSAPGRRAVHVAADGAGVRAFFRPDAGADLPLFPNPPGLGRLADVAVTQALPFLLDRLAEETGGDLAGRVGAIVRAAGDGLDLRTGTPPAFEGARLQAWAADPAASLRAALPTLTATALETLRASIAPLLPGGATAVVTAGELRVGFNGITLAWRPSPFLVTLAGTVDGITAIDSVAIAIELDASGLHRFASRVGPATLDAGGLVLRPFIAATVGEAPAGGRRIELGLALDAAANTAVVARWHLDGAGLTLVAVDGATESTQPADVALALLDAVLDLVASVAIRTDAVQTLLDNAVGTSTVRDVLRGVLLDAADPSKLDDDLFDRDALLDRVKRLATNLAGASPAIDVGGGLAIGLARNAADVVELTLGVNGRVPLSEGDVVVSIEADSRWIRNGPPAGLALGILDATTLAFAPGLAVNGIGLRLAKGSGPLLDAGVTLGSIAVHLFASVQTSAAPSGGAQLQFSDLAVGVAGAQGGNPVAQGLMADAGKGPEKLAPSFSPALAVQKHGTGPVLVSLSAGEGSGPWWLAIQRGFGPIFIEQVGFGVTVEQDQLKRISLLLDGRVSIFGLTAAVDDLQLTYVVASNASVLDPTRWDVDLAGLAVSADMGGILLAGGLRKFGSGDNVEYVGMLVARFAVYGLSVYGGYGTAVVNGERFAAFFAFGAVNGPIGGPPAFFLTGIGGGLGINRGLVFPSSLATFGEFPFIKALDPAAQPSADPMAELTRLREYFPMLRGQFWFAAGISFTSFALVDGVAVVAVSVGDGLEIALLGLARVALPRPQFALVSIELGLIARFSTRDGVLWIQAQLTENSWLLHESVRLTGGFAFVMWFAGPNRGQFVLTMGGFHPRFQRSGYPEVPRLGFQWGVSDAIVVKGESYFALTSEAVMAGGQLSASADFGPAWAHVTFAANGIVYFDPFWFELEIYAKISAGVTIDVWIGEITIRVSIGARVVVSGPEFHAKATFEVGPVDLTVEIGGGKKPEKTKLAWDAFVRKYLEEASPGVARVLTAVPGKGSVPPGTGPGGATETRTADGSAARPFEVLPEFEMTVTSTVPSGALRFGAQDTTHAPSAVLGIAPMAIANAATTLELHFRQGATDWFAAPIAHGELVRDPRRTPGFPVGVWGPPQPEDDRKVPRGDVIDALEGVRFETRAELQGTLPRQVRYNQLDPPGPRKPLPFVHARAARPGLTDEAGDVAALLPPAPDVPATFAAARSWLAAAGHSRTALAALERDRRAPPRLGSLTEGIVSDELPQAGITLTTPVERPPVDVVVRPPRAIAILTAPTRSERLKSRTTVSDAGNATRGPAPTLLAVEALQPLAVAARLVRTPGPAARADRTMVAANEVPLTRGARGAIATVAARGSDALGRSRLDAMTAAISRRAVARGGDWLNGGEIAVLDLPNAVRDLDDRAQRPRIAVRGGDARVLAIGHGGDVLVDAAASREGVPVPRGTERLAVLAIGRPAPPTEGLLGWHSGQELAYLGWSSALGAGVCVRSEGANVKRLRHRFRAGWISGAELVEGTTIVSTRFGEAIASVAIVLDEPMGTDEAQGLSMTLDGADRAPARDG